MRWKFNRATTGNKDFQKVLSMRDVVKGTDEGEGRFTKYVILFLNFSAYSTLFLYFFS